MSTLTSAIENHSLEEILDIKHTSVSIEFSPTSHYMPGLFTSFLQVLCSKIRTLKEFEISTNLSEKNQDQILDNFHNYYHLLTLLLFKYDLNIRDKNGFLLKRDLLITIAIQQFNLQEELYSLTFENSQFPTDSRLHQIQGLRKRLFSDRGPEKTSEGVSFFIPCFDHVRPLRQSSYFYNNLGFLRDKEEVISWIRKLFKYNNLNIREGLERNATDNDIASLIKELFDNTEEWAKSTYDKEGLYNPNLRSCFVNLYLDQRLKRIHSNSDDQVFDYVTSVKFADPSSLKIPNWQSELYADATRIGLCEISILDTGPGMARRWLKKDYNQITLDDELNAVVKCFNKYVTSDISGKSQVRGRGLNSVVRIIGNSGFISIRTGHYRIYRNFLKATLTQEEVSESGLTFKHDERKLIEGTAITILYPFLYSS